MCQFKNKFALIILGILFLFIVIPRLIFPDLDHGDEFTDANVLNAGENFIKFGFVKCRFLPIFEPNLDKPDNPYTHFPPLPEIINGLLRTVGRTDALYFFRSISLFFSLLSLLFWYLLIKRFTNSCFLSFLSAVFYLTNPFFIFGMDSLQESSYSEFLRSLILFIFIVIANLPERKKTLLFFLWILVMLESLITFEYIIYLSLFFILFRVFFRDSKNILSKKDIFMLLLAPVFGFLLHFLQNSWYFGSFSAAFEDLKNVAIQRALRSQDAPPMNFAIWWQYVILRNFSLVFLFNYLTLFLSGFFSYLLYQRLSSDVKEKIRLLVRLFFIFILCGITWYIVFPSHSWAHAFVQFLARHLLPVATLGFTIFCYILISYIKENLSVYPKPYLYSRICLGAIIIVILFNGMFQSELPITPEKIKSAQEFVKFKNCLLKLKEISQENDKVAVNYYRYPFIRYYTNRRCQAIFDRTSLENAENLPQYFIFIPYNNKASLELYQLLNQKYNPLFECNSLRFPTIFFELKNNHS